MRLETDLAVGTIAALATIASVVLTTVQVGIQASTPKQKEKKPVDLVPEANAETGREGAEAAARESARRRRRLQQGREGTITGAGRGLLNETGVRGGGGTGDY